MSVRANQSEPLLLADIDPERVPVYLHAFQHNTRGLTGFVRAGRVVESFAYEARLPRYLPMVLYNNGNRATPRE